MSDLNELIESMEVEWKLNELTYVDIKFKNGQRVVGHVDPWYPNKSPFLMAQLGGAPHLGRTDNTAR